MNIDLVHKYIPSDVKDAMALYRSVSTFKLRDFYNRFIVYEDYADKVPYSFHAWVVSSLYYQYSWDQFIEDCYIFEDQITLMCFSELGYVAAWLHEVFDRGPLSYDTAIESLPYQLVSILRNISTDKRDPFFQRLSYFKSRIPQFSPIEVLLFVSDVQADLYVMHLLHKLRKADVSINSIKEDSYIDLMKSIVESILLPSVKDFAFYFHVAKKVLKLIKDVRYHKDIEVPSDIEERLKDIYDAKNPSGLDCLLDERLSARSRISVPPVSKETPATGANSRRKVEGKGRSEPVA
jgi:hypothetical protein